MEQEKNNSGKISLGLVIILVLVILGLVGYIVYDKVLSNKEDNNETTSLENNFKLTDYVGYWYLSETENMNSANPNSLNIKSVNNNKATIDMYITRTANFTFDVETTNNKTIFEANSVRNDGKISGEIEFLIGTIKLTIVNSTVSGINANTEYEFTYHTDKESSTNSEEYFNELLYTFLPKNSASNFIRNISNFTNDDISLYLFFYYSKYANDNNLAVKADDNVNITYDVSKSDIDALVYKVFGKSASEYEIPEPKGRTGIKKIDEKTYQVFWFATGWTAPDSKLINITKLDNKTVVDYELYGNGAYGNDGKLIGTLKFHLVKNGENWNITKIEYTEK